MEPLPRIRLWFLLERKKWNQLSCDCSRIACLKGPGHLKWFSPVEMQLFWSMWMLDTEDWVTETREESACPHCPVASWNCGFVSPSALERLGSPRVNNPHFVSIESCVQTGWKMQLFILSRPFFISCSSWLVFTNTWKPSNPPVGEEIKPISFPTMWSWEARPVSFTCSHDSLSLLWLPWNYAFQTHSGLVNEEQAGWQNKDFFCGIVHSVSGLFETKLFSPLNLSAFATIDKRQT